LTAGARWARVEAVTLKEAMDIVDLRRRDALRSGKGAYVGKDFDQMAEELKVISRHHVIGAFVEAAGMSQLEVISFIKELPDHGLPRHSPIELEGIRNGILANVVEVAIRFGVDVGRLLQRANAESPQPATDSRENPQLKTEH
jgi:hypothetical protein